MFEKRVKRNINFEKMQPEEYDELIQLWEEADLDFKPAGRDKKENIEKQLQQDNFDIILAKKESCIIGSVIVTHNTRKGWINRLTVLPEFRRKGIAIQLIKQAENWLEQAGIGIFACLVEGWNKKSRQLFEKVGYKDFEGIEYYTKRKFPEI